MVMCHEGNVKVFSLGKTTFYGAGAVRGLEWWEDALHIVLNGDKPPTIASHGVRFKWDVRYISVEWSDLMALPYPRTFWEKLLKVCLGERKVVVSCDGGHGRTGTALAILGSLCGKVKGSPIVWVRSEYCPRAVETFDQALYIKRITGLEVFGTLKSKDFVDLKAIKDDKHEYWSKYFGRNK